MRESSSPHDTRPELVLPTMYRVTPEMAQQQRLADVDSDVAAALQERPLRIRGHHVASFAGVMYRHPDVSAAEWQEELQSMRNADPNGVEAANIARYFPDNQSLQEYLRDVIGNTDQDSLKARLGVAAFLGQIFVLEEDAPVALVVSQKDAICHSCIIGRHCEESMVESATQDRDTVRVVEDIVGFLCSGIAYPPNQHPWSNEPFILSAARLRQTLEFIGELAVITDSHPYTLTANLRDMQGARFHALSCVPHEATAIRQNMLQDERWQNLT